ncbi:MAG: hypothetical protein A3G76_00455 [Acidobacteria bacterium RIFCSPLOWO2_12_FULL_65_11]|nr:MAG: hypothetical protein A3H95_06530 [Acidobacteria bacterium RIFCSPLOWO2_02_FULL_64_15]OFW34121.1 MAG: hypothetical protein A3G76_00455 [Acidobacteria bacterium RIFCSPLOWO2_12_FULL_65_11]
MTSVLALCVCLALPHSLYAQTRSSATGAVEGTVSTQSGAISLPGVLVVVRDAFDVQLNEQVTDGEGRFRIVDLTPGTYRVTAALEGFAARVASVVVVAGEIARANLDLAIAGLEETVNVIAPEAIVTPGETISGAETIGSKEADVFAPGAGLSGALRLLISAIEVPGGVSIKGGRPTQTGIQIGPTSVTDPSLGLAHMNLPDDAIESVSVLPNPYAVEYGRFSSGLVLIRTRRAGDRWKIRLNNLNPTFRTGRTQLLVNIKGISGLDPRVEVGGPIINGRLFLEQTAQYKYSSDEVPSLPEDQRRTTNWLSSFTRLDAVLSPQHSLIVTGGLFPAKATYASLGTFIPPEATFDVHDRVNHLAVTERAVWSEALIAESTFQIDQFNTRVSGQGAAQMEVWPDTTLGNFFNTGRRTPSVFQWIEAFSGSRNGSGGLHLYKFGVDVMRSHYQGTSDSRPVLIRRADGTLSRRVIFSGPTTQDVRSTDVALFAQDRFQPTNRWFVEYGARVDRDGILDRWNFTPRVGAAVLLNASGTSVVRGGFGLFYERTPSAAGAFNQFEEKTETRFDASGAQLGPPVRFAHVTAPDLSTARSTTWDVAYDYRLNPQWSFRASAINRRGSHELIVDPQVLDPAAGTGRLLLGSTGESHYRDLEVGVHFSRLPALDVDMSYVLSDGRGEFNPFANFFGVPIASVIDPNASGPADIPHRLLGRGRFMPTPRWLLLGVVEWRTGSPYSVFNDSLDFVGPRNEERLPIYFRVDLGVERRFRIGKFQPWIGVRASNLLDASLPAEVQANLGSPNVGKTYPSDYRQLRLQLRFER